MFIAAHEISHSFDGTNILFSKLSLTAHEGELIALTGPSGSGKSTLLSILAKWEEPTSGSVEWDGIETIGWVFQNPHGVARRSVLDHVSLPYLAQGQSRGEADEQAHHMLSRFNLEHLTDQAFSTLSGGEAQRLMLARAAAKAPSLLLVDEPTAQLDPRSSVTVNEVLGELAQTRSIVVVATHDVETRKTCDRVIDLRDVVLESEGTTS